MLIVFKVLLVVGALVAVRIFVLSARARGVERLLVLVSVVGAAIAVIYPPITQTAAELVGVGRGVDLMFYVGFLLVFVLLAAQRRLIRSHETSITTLTREIAIATARPAPTDTP